jgi:microcystin-dependent protein
MSRNGSGTYTKINTFSSNNPITASGHNQNWDDIATEITNSVAADGQTTMTGPLKASNGSVTNPSITFGSDQNLGRYRKSTDVMADACNGADVVEYSATGIDVTGEVNATTVKQGGFNLLPVGSYFPYAGTTAPSGYLLCYGQAIDRDDYAALFGVIGTIYGVGDGSTTFNVPDLRGRVVAGQDDMGGSSANRLTAADDGINGDTLGAAGGAETQTLDTLNLPPYTPSGTNTGGAATFNTSGGSFQPGANSVQGVSITPGVGVTTTFTQPTFTGNAQGGASQAFGILQPTFIGNYIIFAGI